MSITKRISIKGILLGFLTDLACSITIGLLIGLAMGLLAVILQARSQGDAQAASELAHRIGISPLVLLGGGLVGLGCTALGGYVCGRVARQAPLLNAGLLGVLSIGLTALMAGKGSPLWFLIFSYVGVLPAALLGGWLASRTHPPRPEPPPVPGP
jgi:hypothetical protein